ncbi:helix-turn-helix transcriptional regulator [Lentibacillus salinarum]|uniref:Helix-turn-helix transcriptional regulator n=1 Tax=Lentibacillus salinarum TaxID=446820 RepID=A0ABW3ZXI2_9BACI
MSKNEKLILARKSKKLTQEQLANRLECKKTTISNWENGYSTPKLSVAFRIANILEKDVNSLFLNKGPNNSC